MIPNLQRSALCAALAKINQVHIDFWAQHQQIDPAPFHKLLQKTLAFLQGELKSEANLLRFHDEFYQWREALNEDDSLAFRIVELANAALHSALESLFDPECDDIELLAGSLNALWDEMEELGGPTQELRQYWQDIEKEIQVLVTEKSQRPLPKSYFSLLKEADVSLFGLEA